MSEKQEPANEKEDDLLADFQDVLGQGHAGAEGQGSDDDGMAELDAFLNEFGQGTEPAAEPVADLDVAAEHLAEPELDEAIPELQVEAADEAPVPELQVEELGEPYAEESEAESLPELQVEAVAGDADEALPEELDLAMEPEPAPAMTAQPPAVADVAAIDDLFDAPITAAAAPDFAPEEAAEELVAEEAPSRRAGGLDVSSVGLALVALVIAAVVGWFAVTLHMQVGDLRAEVAQLRQQPASLATVAAADPQLQQELGRLNQRLNEMAVTIDGPMSHLSESNQRELATIYGRLDTLDKAVNSLRDELGQRPSAGAAAKPAPRQATATAAPKAAAKPRRGSWVVNVASLTDAAAAAVEQKRLKQAGIDTEVEKAVMDGHTWFRVRVTGFASREEAQAYADMAKGKLEGSPWVGPR